jgi:hypothetical protein
VNDFLGFHSEWNLGSPGGWDYQRITQVIGKAIWERLAKLCGLTNLDLDFDHPLLHPVHGLVDMLVQAHRDREGSNPGLIAVVAEEETLADVTENINLARHIQALDGLSGVLTSPQNLELDRGRVCHQGRPVSVLFVDFNTDVLLSLHRTYGLDPLLQAVREHRVINPRGMEPINIKSMFEVLTGPDQARFHRETVTRTPWTRRFFPRRTTGPDGARIPDLLEWTRNHWPRLVLKPERGYSGKGVMVGGHGSDPEASIQAALHKGDYILQEKVPLHVWAEDVPVIEADQVELERVQTDFRTLVGPGSIFGFLGRYGGVPTNVGSGGGVQPMAVVPPGVSTRELAETINQAVLKADSSRLGEIVDLQKSMALERSFTYLLGPIPIALRPRLVNPGQLASLEEYGRKVWKDCCTLEEMWLEGHLDQMISIEPEELDIARLDPWRGSPAIIASDGLFSFGAHPEG